MWNRNCVDDKWPQEGALTKHLTAQKIYILLKHLHATISGWSYDIKPNVTNIVLSIMKRYFLKRMLVSLEVNPEYKLNYFD